MKAWNRRILPLALIGLVSLPKSALASSTDIGTLIVGIGGGGTCGGMGPLIDSGYVPGISKGSYSPIGLTGGRNVNGVIDYDGCITRSELDVATFPSNPGQSWLISITCNGVAKTGASATFSYVSGEAIWQWGTNFGYLSLGSGSMVSCTIVHN